jgi:NADH dehydrogenase
MPRPRIVIIGGGFGGVAAAKVFRGKPNESNARVIFGEVVKVDPAAREVIVDSLGAPVGYDALIVTAGARHSYFDHSEWETFAPGLKSLEDALEIRRRFLTAFERAEQATDTAERDSLMTFVIVGGGPTGVELAGMMIEIVRKAMPRDFRSIDTRKSRVILVEGGPRLLPAMPEPSSARARNVFWAAGNQASPLGAMLGGPVDHAGRVIVRDDLSVPSHPEVFVAGDLAAVVRADGSLVPGVAPAAIQEGRRAALNALRIVNGETTIHFRYYNKGDLATIGRNRAIAVFGRVEVAGYPAWLLWLFVHILYLAGFRNRLSVLIQWAYAYFTFQRGVRLITVAERAAPSVTRSGDRS